jgi:hypothetical protein
MPSTADKVRADDWDREEPTSATMAAAGSDSGGIDADAPSDDATHDIDVPHQRDELFPEDTGTCPLPVRHAIAALIKRRYISADEDKVAWDGLMSDPDLVRSRLADCLLTLKISRGAGIALAQQVELEDNTVPYKIKSITYFNNVQSLLITQLVTKYFSSTAAGESAVWVEEEEMCETMMRLFEDAPDVAAADQAMRQAIAAMERNHYLRKIADGRYQIMPVVGVVYTLDEISAILARYGMGKEAPTQEEESDE